PISNQLLMAVCGVISRCNSQVTFDQCQGELQTVTGFAPPLGLSPSYGTFSSIVQGEQSGTLVGSSFSGDSCYQSINNLSCASPVVQSAYDPSLSQPFQGASSLLNGQSCGDVFAGSAQYTCSKKVFLTGMTNSPLIPAVAVSGFRYSVVPALPQ